MSKIFLSSCTEIASLCCIILMHAMTGRQIYKERDKVGGGERQTYIMRGKQSVQKKERENYKVRQINRKREREKREGGRQIKTEREYENKLES